MRERRIFERVSCQKVFSLYDVTTKREYEASCQDISGGGVKVAVKFPLRLMHPLELRFPSKGRGKQILKLQSRAVWQRDAGDGWMIGIEFNPSRRLLDVRMLFA